MAYMLQRLGAAGWPRFRNIPIARITPERDVDKCDQSENHEHRRPAGPRLARHDLALFPCTNGSDSPAFDVIAGGWPRTPQSETRDREAILRARRGQGRFKQRVMEIEVPNHGGREPGSLRCQPLQALGGFAERRAAGQRSIFLRFLPSLGH